MIPGQIMTWEGKRVLASTYNVEQDGYVLALEGTSVRAFVDRRMMREMTLPVVYGTKIMDQRNAVIRCNTYTAAPERPQERIQARAGVIGRQGFGGHRTSPLSEDAEPVEKRVTREADRYLAEAMF